MARPIEKIEYDLERARRERDAWQKNRGGSHQYQMASLAVSALEKELSEAVSDQNKDDHKTPDSV
ncbi:hypothetical protein [Kosakonia oryzendophytica]|uniref:hypothetical protein n=1 Tax=Kosakonia oryzendophytica TaxID=1005665 RepID=UPI000777F988|nr:hypothetical protein [Kosakonia oryzendophytica]WBT56076.1 hypothetical protein O9K67_12765 [Kosakonia oryzendophytica]WBT56088.1 hypothetical protein O9K67_12835 [Kosakonia oryzendophytica]DAT25624.1 MAG TPA: hypothetical protein [Inoviridae sp.]